MSYDSGRPVVSYDDDYGTKHSKKILTVEDLEAVNLRIRQNQENEIEKLDANMQLAAIDAAIDAKLNSVKGSTSPRPGPRHNDSDDDDDDHDDQDPVTHVTDATYAKVQANDSKVHAANTTRSKAGLALRRNLDTANRYVAEYQLAEETLVRHGAKKHTMDAADVNFDRAFNKMLGMIPETKLRSYLEDEYEHKLMNQLKHTLDLHKTESYYSRVLKGMIEHLHVLLPLHTLEPTSTATARRRMIDIQRALTSIQQDSC